MHPIASKGPSALGFGGQPCESSAFGTPLGSAAVDAKVQRLHGHIHRAETRSWSPPTSRSPAATPPPRWVQPRLSATPHKATVSATMRQQPTGKRQSVTALAAPASCATVPLYNKLPGPLNQCAWQPYNSQALRGQRVETWPLLPTATTEIQQRPSLPRQGMPSQRATLGQHVLGQLQGQLHMPSGGARMATPRRGITSKADLLAASAWLGGPGATQPTETSGDELVQKHIATLCTPALSSRKEPRCWSPSLRP